MCTWCTEMWWNYCFTLWLVSSFSCVLILFAPAVLYVPFCAVRWWCLVRCLAQLPERRGGAGRVPVCWRWSAHTHTLMTTVGDKSAASSTIHSDTQTLENRGVAYWTQPVTILPQITLGIDFFCGGVYHGRGKLRVFENRTDDQRSNGPGLGSAFIYF